MKHRQKEAHLRCFASTQQVPRNLSQPIVLTRTGHGLYGYRKRLLMGWVSTLATVISEAEDLGSVCAPWRHRGGVEQQSTTCGNRHVDR
jgi:hypothetical protein